MCCCFFLFFFNFKNKVPDAAWTASTLFELDATSCVMSTYHEVVHKQIVRCTCKTFFRISRFEGYRPSLNCEIS